MGGLVFAGAAHADDDPLRHGYALLIGDWAYNDSRWPQLDDVRLQIDQLHAALSPHFDHVEVLPNPTFEQLDVGLRRFLRIRGNDERARLFVYYAGHGYTETDFVRNERRGFITGIDTPYIDGSAANYSGARVTALSMEAVRAMVSDTAARQVLFVFDSCFAGTVFNARSPQSSSMLSADEVTRMTAVPVREFITAGDANERVPAHSPIPQLLLNALDGEADRYNRGVITGQEIADYLLEQTRNAGAGITPRSGKLSGIYGQGEFLFRVGLARARPWLPPSVSYEFPMPPRKEPLSRNLAAKRPPATKAQQYFVYFHSGEAVLTDQARRWVAQAAAAATSATYARISVIGHTDTALPPRESLDLSVRMARTVAEELVSRGVSKETIQSAGRGSVNPPVLTGPDVSEPWNRRVEITLVP